MYVLKKIDEKDAFGKEVSVLVLLACFCITILLGISELKTQYANEPQI